MIPYNYDLIIGPARKLLDILFCLRLIYTKGASAYMPMTNGEFHDRLASYR